MERRRQTFITKEKALNVTGGRIASFCGSVAYDTVTSHDAAPFISELALGNTGESGRQGGTLSGR